MDARLVIIHPSGSTEGFVATDSRVEHASGDERFEATGGADARRRLSTSTTTWPPPGVDRHLPVLPIGVIAKLGSSLCGRLDVQAGRSAERRS